VEISTEKFWLKNEEFFPREELPGDFSEQGAWRELLVLAASCPHERTAVQVMDLLARLSSSPILK